MINIDYLQARRLARRFESPHLTVPTCERLRLRPKVRIGCLRDPALPIEILPAIHTPPKHTDWWLDAALWAASGVAVVMSFVFVGW